MAEWLGGSVTRLLAGWVSGWVAGWLGGWAPRAPPHPNPPHPVPLTGTRPDCGNFFPVSVAGMVGRGGGGVVDGTGQAVWFWM